MHFFEDQKQFKNFSQKTDQGGYSWLFDFYSDSEESASESS